MRKQHAAAGQRAAQPACKSPREQHARKQVQRTPFHASCRCNKHADVASNTFEARGRLQVGRVSSRRQQAARGAACKRLTPILVVFGIVMCCPLLHGPQQCRGRNGARERTFWGLSGCGRVRVRTVAQAGGCRAIHVNNDTH